MGDEDRIYYMTPKSGEVPDKKRIYYMTPKSGVNGQPGIYYMTPKKGIETNWEFYKIGVFEPITQAKPDWNEEKGNYGGYGGRIYINGGYKFVMIIPVGSYWGDCIFDPATCPEPYRGTLGFKTQNGFGIIGPGGTREASEKRFVDMGDALDAWVSSDPLVLPLGSDGYLAWGFQDLVPSNNIGFLQFKIYIKKV